MDIDTIMLPGICIKAYGPQPRLVRPDSSEYIMEIDTNKHPEIFIDNNHEKIGTEMGYLMDYIMKNLTYPEAVIWQGISGTVYIGFHIQKDGTINDAKALRKVYADLNQVVLKIFDGIPKFNPKNISTKTRGILPVKFILEF
jgi:hypothetical protein